MCVRHRQILFVVSDKQLLAGQRSLIRQAVESLLVHCLPIGYVTLSVLNHATLRSGSSVKWVICEVSRQWSESSVK